MTAVQITCATFYAHAPSPSRGHSPHTKIVCTDMQRAQQEPLLLVDVMFFYRSLKRALASS